VAGVEHRPDEQSKISVEGFYKFYDDYPFSVLDSVSIASKGGDFGVFGNEEVVSTDKGRAYGFEVFARDTDFFGFNTILSYTFVRSKFEYVGGTPYTPFDEDKSSLVQAWNVQGGPYLNFGEFNTLRLSPFHQLDVRVDKQYFFDKWSLMVYVDIQNLYNFQSESPPIYIRELNPDDGTPIIENPNAPPSEQRYQLEELQTTSGTVLPTIGIMVEF
jgi:hypothetical protein